MAVIDTTNVLDSSMFLKAKLKKNLVGDNYYIQSLQQKRNSDWSYRYNVVDIEEEQEKQLSYTSEHPIYSPIEAAIMTVKTDTGEILSDDWRRLVFKDLNYLRFLGKRYRFGYDFDKTPFMTDKEKHYNNSIWISVNMNSSSPGSDVVVRRCNSNVLFVGSPDSSYDNITETHAEPCIIENDLKRINTFYNQHLSLPQSEIFLIFQLNYFTKGIQINDRLIIGDTFSYKENNQAFNVVAVNNFSSVSTFQVGYDVDVLSSPLIIVGLKKDVLFGGDNFIERVAEHAPLYKVEEQKKDPVNQYYLKVANYENIILLSSTQTCEVYLYKDNVKYNNIINFTCSLIGIEDENQNDYYNFVVLSNNSFSIFNKKQCKNKELKVVCTCVSPVGIKTELDLNFTLGGFY